MSAPPTSAWRALLSDRVFMITAPLVVLSLVMIYLTREWDPLTPSVVADPASLAPASPDPVSAGTSGRTWSSGLTATAIRRGLMLDTDAALLYRVVNDRLEVRAITRSRDARVGLDVTVKACDRRITAFCRCLLQPGFGRPAVDEARALHRMLVQPALEALGNPRVERLLVVPAGPIARLPFAALAAGDDWTWLGFFVVTSCCPEPLQLEARATTAAPVRAARVFALTGEGEASAREATHIAAHGGERSEVFVGPAGQRRPLAAAVAVAPPDLLYFASGAAPADLSGLDLENTLVNAPAAPPSRFVDPLAASRPFLDAGAAAVIAPRWPIAPRVRRKFLGRLCHHLAAGADVGHALAETRRDFSRSPGIGGPATWASFALVGNDRRQLALTEPFRWFSLWWTLALVATLVAGFRVVSVVARRMDAQQDSQQAARKDG